MDPILPINTLDEVTDMWMQAIIRQYLKEEVYVVKIKKKQDSRCGFLSEILFLDAILKERDSLSLVVKIAPVDKDRRNLLLEGNLAEAENAFYKYINLPYFKDILATFKISPPVPTVLYCEKINNAFTLVMEDLCSDKLNYCRLSSDIADLKVTNQAIEAIAVMHALGYAYIEKYGITSLGVMLKKNEQDQLNMTKLIKKGVDVSIRNTRILDKTILDTLHKLKSSEDYPLFFADSESNLPESIIHGDYWIGQTMSNKQTGNVSILDWQFAQLSNPTYDIAIFLITSSNTAVYRNHIEKVIQSYVTKLNDNLVKLTCSVIISHDQVLSSLNKAWHKGFLIWFASLGAQGTPKDSLDRIDDTIKFGFEKGIL